MSISKKPFSSRGNEQTMKEAIAAMLDVYRLRGRLSEQQLLASWEKVLGSVVARRTDKLYIKNKILFAHLSSAALRQELHYEREKIKDLLNKEVGAEVITDIVLK